MFHVKFYNRPQNFSCPFGKGWNKGWRGVRPYPPKRSVHNLTVNFIWRWGSRSLALRSVKYLFIVITSRFTLPGVVVPVRILSMGKIDIIHKRLDLYQVIGTWSYYCLQGDFYLLLETNSVQNYQWLILLLIKSLSHTHTHTQVNVCALYAQLFKF